MERIEVVERAAAMLVASRQAAAFLGAARVEWICAALSLQLQVCPSSDVMLGGAYSRLQLWVWDQPEVGGFIWLRDDLAPETRIFAIAHELGHYTLHRGEGINAHPACDQGEIDQQADPGDLRTEDHRVEEYTPRARRELEASAFAAELLAPRAEVRRIFTADPDADVARLATHFGVSRMLAHRRIIDAVLAPSRPIDHGKASAPDAPGSDGMSHEPGALIARLDTWQRQAARAQGPVLVVAGPGTGKTATLVGRVAYLIEERHIPPEQVLALTFSNRAAGEMRARLTGSGLPGERMPIMTIHAFAATLLREYSSRVPHAADEAELDPDFRILDEANAYLLMEELLGELPLRYYRSLGNPTAHLNALRTDFSHARNELMTPADYLALVDAMPLAPADDQASDTENADEQGRTKSRKKQRKKPPPDGTFTIEQIAKARERAEAYAVWDRALRRRGLVDFGCLIQRAVELLRSNATVLADVRMRYPQLLVDEFQDTNHAAANLLMLVAGASGGGLWVVGDRNQSIYRFRGASPLNLPRLVEQYPGLRVLTLRRCYRAVPDIVRLGSAMAARMAELAPDMPASAGSDALREALRPLDLEPVREDGARSAIRRAEVFVSAAHEQVGLAAAIERYHEQGYAYKDQAILCRTHKQVRQIAAVLAQQGVPVSQPGDFFERPEVKDALMLLLLAAGPDARGMLRATPLLVGLGYPPPASGELAAVARYFSSQRRPLPGALRDRAALGQIAPLSPATRAGLTTLGEVATSLRNGATVGQGLAAFLLRPAGYAWRLARVADEIDAPQSHDPLAGMESPARAQQALAALGELVRLAWRFDIRWAREPEFRARLSRAVTHRRAARLADPDTLAPPPAADVIAPDTPGATGSPMQPAEAAPAVRCFLHYLRALRATDGTLSLPAGEEDAIAALTLHQSKGLEFPVVFLPNLAHGQFPTGRHGNEEVCPPGFRASDAPGEDDAEERCLFYVGVTRARDVVVFSRAGSYSKKSSNKAPTAAERSSLLALVADTPGWEEADPLFPDDEYDRLIAVAAAYEEPDEDEGDDESEAGPIAGQTPTTLAAEQPTYSLHDLEQYLTCPLQYKYACHYGLQDPAENAISRFHRYVRRGTRELRDIQAATLHADWGAAEARLRTLWETDGPAGHAYDAFYWQAAEVILREEWRAITSPDGAAAADRVTLAQPLQARLKQCIVAVTADRVIDGAARTTDGDSAQLTVLVRLHTGRPGSDDKDDLTLPLYYLAHEQEHPGVPAQIMLAYAGSALEDESAGAYDPRNQQNVTNEARADAEKYLDPKRRRRSKLDKLDEAAMGIAADQFAPHPDERRCAACPYCYVCPSDPESAASGLTLRRPLPQSVREPEALVETGD